MSHAPETLEVRGLKYLTLPVAISTYTRPQSQEVRLGVQIDTFNPVVLIRSSSSVMDYSIYDRATLANAGFISREILQAEVIYVSDSLKRPGHVYMSTSQTVTAWSARSNPEEYVSAAFRIFDDVWNTLAHSIKPGVLHCSQIPPEEDVSDSVLHDTETALIDVISAVPCSKDVVYSEHEGIKYATLPISIGLRDGLEYLAAAAALDQGRICHMAICRDYTSETRQMSVAPAYPVSAEVALSMYADKDIQDISVSRMKMLITHAISRIDSLFKVLDEVVTDNNAASEGRPVDYTEADVLYVRFEGIDYMALPISEIKIADGNEYLAAVRTTTSGHFIICKDPESNAAELIQTWSASDGEISYISDQELAPIQPLFHILDALKDERSDPQK